MQCCAVLCCVLPVSSDKASNAGVRERQAMAAAFAALPVKVLWRLAQSEVPDEAALAELGIGSNTKVLLQNKACHLFAWS